MDVNVNYGDLFSLKDKTAIVTGGLGLLGKKFCMGLAEFGANVVVADMDQNEANKFASKLNERYNSRSIGLYCDVTSQDSILETLKQVVDCFGKIDVLHNNAATKTSDLDEFFRDFETYSLETWRKIMAVNIDGMFLMAQGVGKQMLSQPGGGSIIQTSSIYGILGPDQRIYEGSLYMEKQINTPAVYSVSKAAVIGLTKYLATYWAGKGVRVNTLTLGGIESGQNDIFINRYSDRIPMQRMAKQDEVVGALLFLASDASSYVNGQNIIVDGGLSAW